MGDVKLAVLQCASYDTGKRGPDAAELMYRPREIRPAAVLRCRKTESG
jgi:hypothetical protein